MLFEKEVEERTGGAIDVEIYDSATLYKDSEVPAAVGAGSIEACRVRELSSDVVIDSSAAEVSQTPDSLDGGSATDPTSWQVR